MPAPPSILSLLRPRGLSGRVVMLASGLVLGSAALTTLIIAAGLIWSAHVAPVFIALAGGLITALLFTASYVRGITAPIEALARRAMDIIRDGEGKPELRPGAEIAMVATALDTMSARLDASMRRIQEIAFIDSITQLPNYDRFQREIDAKLFGLGDERTPSMVAVFVLKRLPRLLQTMESKVASDVMRTIAARFEAAARAAVAPFGGHALLLCARLGGNEFALFVGGVGAADNLMLAQHVTDAINKPFDWRGHKLSIGASCGATLAPRDGREAEALIRRARVASALAEGGEARVKTFTPAMDREASARMSLEREMRFALERNEFHAYFQPKLSLVTGRIEGCEALARWVRPDRTIIGPGRFIPVAEESGLIAPLSEAIMREACWKAAGWARAGHPAKVAVNVSALQFQNEKFAEGVLRTLEYAGLPASFLELEITETVAMEDPERSARIIAPLREAGVRLAIDDFGCGYSSLAALSKLPFDVLKIDRQFLGALERGQEHGAAIVDVILALARTLNMEVVAEGVERQAEAEFMAARGCHWAQGFLYGAAVAAPEFAELLRRQAEGEATIVAA